MNDDDSMKQHEFQNQINLILKKASSFLQEKNYKQASAIVGKGLETYPEQKDLLNLFEEIKKQHKNEKIQKLQEEAVMFMSTGAEDEAQHRLRQISELDPSRTDLKQSFKKTRSEIAGEYNERVKRMELIRLGSLVFLTIAVILCSIVLWAWWSNDRCLKKSEKFIASGKLYNARQELKRCGWFLAGEKQKVNKELQSAINELIDRARHYAELKEFQNAKEYLKIAAQALEDGSEIEEQIRKYDQLEQQWKEELSKQKIEQEKQIALSERASTAKKEFQKALEQSLESEAAIGAKDTLELAKNKAEAAEKLFSQNQFESAEKQWLSAAEECQTALKIAEETKISRAAALIFKLKCAQTAESALKVNAPVEASEIWQEAEKIHNSAEQNFAQNNFDAAGQLWEQATNKYDEALQTAMQSPAYKKALLMQKKWLQLKQGSNEEDIRNILGSPKCVQAASDHCIWYYQRTPIASKIDEGNYECIHPQCGYVRFETVGIENIIERNKKAYQKYMDEEQKMHEKSIDSLNRQIQEENERHSSFKVNIPNIRRGGQKVNIPNTQRHTTLYGIHNTEQDRRDEERKRQEAYQAEEQRHNKQIQWSEDSIVKENQRHQDRIEKLPKDLQTKIDNLTNGLSPRETHYIVSDWKLPDQNDLVCLLVSEEIKEKGIKPRHKWQMPIRWKALRLNIKEDEAYTILGFPTDTSPEPGKKIYRYGQITDYGFLTFEECADSLRRLKYWKEPLWAYVAQELQSEKQLSDPNRDAGFDEPNEPNEPNKPDANDANGPS